MNQQQPAALAAIVNQLQTGGWAAFDNIGQGMAENLARMKDEAEREARVVQACFETPQGQACLQWLIEKTLLRGPNQDEAGAVTAEHFALASAKRFGQNSVVWMILTAMNYKENQA